MTPIFGIVFAICAAVLAPTLRTALMVEVSLMATATAIQTWDLGAGLGSNPASTVREVSYWIVQAIIVAIISVLTAGGFTIRRRRARRAGHSLVRDGFVGNHGGVALAVGHAALIAVGLVIVVAMYSIRATHGRGVGDIPAAGLVGIILGAAAAAALAVIDTARQSGLRVRYTLQGEPSQLTPAAAEIAHRVIREALTNSVKHAPGADVNITDESGSDVMLVRVRNGPPNDQDHGLGAVGGGHGLAGMRERIQRLGGVLDAGPDGQGGWQVNARIPIRVSTP